MSNELLWILFILFDLSFALLVFKLFGKYGLYAIIVADIILCNIQVTKLVTLFGFTMTLGNILYGSIFFATDVLSEIYGKNDAKKGVYLGFIFLIFMTIVMQIALLFKPDPADFISPHLKAIFSMIPRITLGSLTAYIVSQLHDVWAFHFWKAKTKGRYLWVRNNLSTMVSQMIDTVIFCFIAFWGLYDLTVFFNILLTTYLMKWIVAILDTPFIYLARRISFNIEI